MTHLIANDVVNLRNPFNQNVELSNRYLDKSYTPLEQEVINNSENPLETMWLFWSCKESLFKMLTKLYGAKRFNPTAIEVLISDEEMFVGERVVQSVIRWEDVQLRSISTISGHAISTVCASSQHAFDNVFSAFENVDETADESEAVRELLFRHLASTTKLQCDQLNVNKNRLGVPKLLIDGRHSAIDISFSHDFGLVGFALLAPAKTATFS